MSDSTKTIIIQKDDHARESELSVNFPNPNQLVSVHYPIPIKLSSILDSIATWSELCFIFDPELETYLQIFAPKKITKEEAFKVFVASLDTVGRRAIYLSGSIIKVSKKFQNI